MQNPIDIAEVAYDVTGSDVEWLTRIAHACRPALDGGFGVCAYLVQIDFGRRKLERTSPVVTAGDAPDELEALMVERMEDLDPSTIRPEYLSADRTVTSASESFLIPEGTSFERWERYAASRRLGIADYLNARSFDADGRGVVIDAGVPELTRTTPQQVERWRSVSVHLLAGLRLRRLLSEGVARVDERGRVEAIADSVSDEDVAAVREAATAIHAARGALRDGDPDRALELWQGLVSGLWSMVDQFDTDGRRYLVARKNEPAGFPLPGLSTRERQVVAYAVMGRSNKHIAYTLGVAPSTISAQLQSALSKLGVPSRDDLLRLVGAAWRPQGPVS
ncbi:MAG: LuxR C-terminal-related transcriptional regulator [Sandaracinaceae bacterium]|nr:LuxR C-terminal-related transcriptional regulator [Sandaracinaceae bacterium]